jgi:hypothetical protein
VRDGRGRRGGVAAGGGACGGGPHAATRTGAGAGAE